MVLLFPIADNADEANTIPAETFVSTMLVDVILTVVRVPATYKLLDKLKLPPEMVEADKVIAPMDVEVMDPEETFVANKLLIEPEAAEMFADVTLPDATVPADTVVESKEAMVAFEPDMFAEVTLAAATVPADAVVEIKEAIVPANPDTLPVVTLPAANVPADAVVEFKEEMVAAVP